jgi:hypothetical protein
MLVGENGVKVEAASRKTGRRAKRARGGIAKTRAAASPRAFAPLGG